MKEVLRLDNKKGYIALVTVLIIGMVSMIFLVASFAIAVENAKNVQILENGTNARLMANTCGEYLLKKMRESKTYPGNQTITINGNSCHIYPVEVTPQGYVGKVEGYSGNNTRKVKIEMNQISTNVLESWWREVADF